jgi:tetratricopeptide (TPR) repeat protein
MRSVVASAIVALIVVSAPLGALFRPPDLENVPIERLVVNLERLSRENPADLLLRLNLARVHAMAYARKTDQAQIRKGREQDGVWVGSVPVPEPLHMQFPVKTTRDEAAAKVARAHLEKATSLYREILAVAPSTPVPQTGRSGRRFDRVAQLGLGWCLAQAGERDAAIAALRQVVENGWPADRTDLSVWHGQRSLTEEAIRYLVPLLDREKDEEEIARLRSRASELARMARPITPLAIPLRRNLTALDITDFQANVLFDGDGSGIVKRWTWITPDAGWLVFDRRGTGQIDAALQLFGNVTFWLFWENGYQPLRALDGNGDRQLTDDELEGLAIWHDRNVNGQSEPGEVRPVSDWHVVALSSEYEIDPAHPDEIAFSPAGVTFRDGSSRPTFDVVLHAAGRALSRPMPRR